MTMTLHLQGASNFNLRPDTCDKIQISLARDHKKND